MRLEHWTYRQNVRGNKPVLHDLSRLLTGEIRRRRAGSRSERLDFRFLIPLGQWLVEQGGYTMTPQGNNPGNVMGRGDAGVFHRAQNHEFVNGVRTMVPADFAAFSSMRVGTAATFDHLEKRWPGAYQAMLGGGSPDAYVMGLYPGGGKDYATAPKSHYMSGLRFRIRNIIADYRAAHEDDVKEADGRIAQLQGYAPSPAHDAAFMSEVGSRIARNRDVSDGIGVMLAELAEIEKRLAVHQALQPL